MLRQPWRTSCFYLWLLFCIGTSQHGSQHVSAVQLQLPVKEQRVTPSGVRMGSPISFGSRPLPLHIPDTAAEEKETTSRKSAASQPTTTNATSSSSNAQPIGKTPLRPVMAVQRKETMRVRKEIRDLTTAERESFIRSFWKLNENGVMARLTQDHYRWSKQTHGKPCFIVYHRAITLQFEDELLKVDPLLTGLPYWDWTIDFQHPPSSIVMTPDWFGPTPSLGNDTCITTGSFAHFPAVQCSTKKNLPCLARGFGTAIPARDWVSPALVDAILRRSNKFDKFARSMEASIHPYPHLGFGGHMKTMCSAADPIFYLHHSNVDRMYTQWQQIHFGQNKTDARWATQQMDSLLPDDFLLPYFNRTVASYLDSQLDLHYTYEKASTPVRYLKPLALPPPLPREWNDMNGWSDAMIREQRQFVARLTNDLNGFAARQPHGSLNGVALDRLWSSADTTTNLTMSDSSADAHLTVPLCSDDPVASAAPTTKAQRNGLHRIALVSVLSLLLLALF